MTDPIDALPAVAGAMRATWMSSDGERRVEVLESSSTACVHVLARHRADPAWQANRALGRSLSTLAAIWVHAGVVSCSPAEASARAASMVGSSPRRLLATTEHELDARGSPGCRLRVETWQAEDGSQVQRHLQTYIVAWRPCGENNDGRPMRFGVADIEVFGERSTPVRRELTSGFEIVGVRIAGGRRPLRLEMLRRQNRSGRGGLRVRALELDCMEIGGPDARRVWCTWPDDSELTRDLAATELGSAWREATAQVESIQPGRFRFPD